jgi:cation transport ATPase
MAHVAHDMSDPGMAAAMEAEMRRRFWISLVLALPVIAYSSLGSLLLGGRTLPRPFGIPSDWVMLVFATPIALWTSSVFHVKISRATVRKMKQNLFWAAVYNVVAIPVASGVLYPSFGVILQPEFGALAMSASSITVVSNALLLRREV